VTDIVEEQTDSPPREGAGARLKRERESQGLSLFDAARALRLSEKQMAALEADDYSKLPGRTFVRGFIRNYARLVQLDPEPLMAQIFFGNDEESHQIQAPSQKIRFSEHESKPWLKWLLMAFVVVAVVSWAVLQWLGPEETKSAIVPRTAEPVALPSKVAPAQPEIALAPEPVVAMPAAGIPPAEPATPARMAVSATTLARLNMTFSGRAWVEVRDKNGKIIHSQNNTAGTDQAVEGEAPLSLVIGSSPNVKLIYKGQPVDLSAFAKADVARLTLE
jgi:cytoskeleton protein RodZ